MNTRLVGVLAGSIAICILAADLFWHRVQHTVARSRIGDKRTVRATSTGRRIGLRGVIDGIARRRPARGNRPDPGAVAAVLDQTARQCASGVSLGEAFVTATNGSVLEHVFAAAIAALTTGESIGAALELVPVDQPDVALATHVLRLCALQGGTVSESLDRAAATLREREAVARERVAQSAQARLSARVLTVLPIAFGGWTILTTPTVQRFFLTPIGVACLLLGLGLNASGWLLMRRVSRGLP
jgi:tight adherence protein B